MRDSCLGNWKGAIVSVTVHCHNSVSILLIYRYFDEGWGGEVENVEDAPSLSTVWFIDCNEVYVWDLCVCPFQTGELFYICDWIYGIHMMIDHFKP